MSKKEVIVKENKATSYTKQQFLNSNKFTPVEKDILNFLLKDGKTYTTEQVKKLTNDFLKKEVK